MGGSSSSNPECSDSWLMQMGQGPSSVGFKVLTFLANGPISESSLLGDVSGGVDASTFSTTTPELEDAVPALFFTFLRLTFRLLVAGEDFVVLLGGNDVLTAKFGTPPREDKDLVATRVLPSGIALERIWRWDCIEPAVSGCLCTDLLVPYPCLVCSMAVRSTVYGNRLEQVAKLTLVSPLR